MFDFEFARSQFPALSAHPRANQPGQWAFFDNAGGSLAPKQVIEAVTDYMSTLQMQLCAHYPASQTATDRVRAGRQAMATFMDCHPDEVVINGSTTVNANILAQALAPSWQPGDVVIISQADHEANRSAWKRLSTQGIEIRQWPLHKESLTLRWQELEPLMDRKVKLVAYTQCANVVGAIHEVQALNQKIHACNALVCVDGVAYAPHRRPKPAQLDCDFYLWSAYKVYGPHLGVMYGKKDLLLGLSNRNHVFLSESEIPYKLQPGNVNHELGAALTGTLDYFNALCERQGHHGSDALDKVSADIAQYESELSAPLLAFLNEHPKISLFGPVSQDPAIRVPTIAFRVQGHSSESIAKALAQDELAIRYGSFYAREAVTEAMGLSVEDGVCRVSLVHYNSPDEIKRLIQALDTII